VKKTIFTFLLVMIFCGAAQAQIFKPSVNVIVRGNYSLWLSDSTWKNEYKEFPGVQLEAVVNLTSMWGISGTFAADFISAKDRTLTIPGATFTQESSSQIAGYLGPRYYINLPGNKMVKIYIDAAAGLYSFKPGTFKMTETTNPPRITTISFNSVSQFGFNAGAGVNIGLGPSMFANLMVKYHNVLKKTDVVFREKITVEQQGTTTTTTINSTPEDIPARSYFQFGIGLGFTFGM
jgi:opacity protein-like surface antigen